MVYPACTRCVKSMEMYEILDSNPPSYLWRCNCGQCDSSQHQFPMDIKSFECYMFQGGRGRTKEFNGYSRTARKEGQAIVTAF